jgi:hypothetical protein
MASIHLAFVQCTLSGAFVEYISGVNAAVAVTRVCVPQETIPSAFLENGE